MILLTGHEGFIGSSLRYYYPNEEWFTFPVMMDVTTPQFRNRVSQLDGLEAIVHCAGNSIVSHCEMFPMDAFQSNTMAVASVLESVRGRDIPVIVLESDKVYGNQQVDMVDETAPLLGFSPYEKSKVLAAELCDFYRDYYGMNVISLRLTNTYGPLDGNLSRLIPGTIDRLRRDEAPVVWAGSADHRRDYLWIGDLCDVIMEMVGAENLAGAYNVTSEENYSTREVIDIIQEEMGTNKTILYREKEFSEIPYQRMDGGKLYKALGGAPTTKLRDGIRKMLDNRGRW
jgi:nucleoside-diphosphate-sugar epimerase